MRTASFIVMILATASILSCGKEKNTNVEIYGVWELAEEIRASEGISSGRFVKVDGASRHLIIRRDGRLQGDALINFSGYSILGHNTMEVKMQDRDKPLICSYQLQSDTLTLYIPCYEACGYKFVR